MDGYYVGASVNVRSAIFCYQLHLKAVTISDLTCLSGRTLDQNKLWGHHSILSSYTYGTSIHQERPSESAWKLWEKANKLWSTIDGCLIQPLGDWILPLHKLRQRHPLAYWFSGRQWIQIQDCYTKCTQDSERIFRETGNSSKWSSLPPQAIPMVALQFMPGSWQIVNQSHILELHGQPIAGTFTQYIASLPQWEKELLDRVEMICNPFSIAVALEHGLRVVSDGSDGSQIQVPVWDGTRPKCLTTCVSICRLWTSFSKCVSFAVLQSSLGNTITGLASWQQIARV